MTALPSQSDRPEHSGIIPHLTCNGAADAIEFYKSAFGAEELMRMPDESGKLMHACIEINGAHVFMHDNYPEYGSVDPATRGGYSVTMHIALNTPDEVNAWYQRAIDAGCAVEMELADQFWGDRYGMVKDKWGHAWSFGAQLA